ncbi:uncharacterized protein [Fopius arisanus]|uniref:Uncharacterized protein isoform X2 n=1 Tax=Fopius arisanus TaxID=64838 RepID=A0A9R1TFH0_9HYME|nr:PREDICTED: uncharacterized protein LOC105269490 isoform X2 [Fopius arisanus]
MEVNIFILLLGFFGVFLRFYSAQGVRRSPALKFQVDDDSNSPALNSFLENVLRAKDELKSIDRTVNSGGHWGRSTKRRLLWSQRPRRLAAIRDYGSDKDADGIGDRSAANEGDIETILGELGFSGENSPVRSIGKNERVERRRYPISDLTGSGIIEYYDYEGDVGKRDSMNSINASGIATPASDHLETMKKFVGISSGNGTEGTTLPYPRQEFLSDEVHPGEERKFIVDLDDHVDENREDRDMEISNDLDTLGREARCHREEDNGDNGMLFHSHFLEIQEFEIIPARASGSGEPNIRSPKASKPGQTFFIISPVNSPEENGSSTSGSDYQALKVTDDMFKGGVEQGNSPDDSSIHFPDRNQIQNDKHWKLLQEGDEDSKNGESLEVIPSNKAHPIEIHRESTNKEAADTSGLKISRRKRTNGVGPIMHRESVEPLEVSWEGYGEENRMGLGRELMQATEDSCGLLTCETTSSRDFSRSATRHRDINQDFKEIWRSRGLSYLHGKSPHFHKGKRRFIKKIPSLFRTLGRGKRDMDEHSRNDHMGIVIGDVAGKIVDKIFEQVENNEPLKMNLGPGLNRHSKPGIHSPGEVLSPSDPEEVKRTEEIMRKVMELLGHLVSDEVDHKTCRKLPPHLHEFLVWMVRDEELREPQRTTAVVYSKAKESLKPEKFPSSQRPETQTPLPSDLYRKVRLLKGLIKEYFTLSEKEQTKVQAVHDYLERQLHSLLKFIESKDKAKPQLPIPTKKRSTIALHSRLHGDDDELQNFPLKPEGWTRRRRQVVKKLKMKKHRSHNPRKNNHPKKSHNRRVHSRWKRSMPPVNYLPWEVPRIFNGNLKFLSNSSSTGDEALRILFEGTRPSESDGSTKSSTRSSTPGTSPKTIGTAPKIHPPELITTAKTTAVSLTLTENSGKVNIIGKEGVTSRTLNSLESRINVFPVSP